MTNQNAVRGRRFSPDVTVSCRGAGYKAGLFSLSWSISLRYSQFCFVHSIPYVFFFVFLYIHLNNFLVNKFIHYNWRYLPPNTPDYIVYIETSLSPLHIFTSKLCIVLKNHSSNRLTNYLANIIVHKEIYWYRQWLKWCLKPEILIPYPIRKTGSRTV